VANNPEYSFNNDYIEICTQCGKIILEGEDRFCFPPTKIIFCIECVEQIKRDEISQKNSITPASVVRINKEDQPWIKNK
jgi:hypothetical protein